MFFFSLLQKSAGKAGKLIKTTKRTHDLNLTYIRCSYDAGRHMSVLCSFSLCCSFFAYDYQKRVDPVGIYLLKVYNRNTRTRCQICLKLTMKTPERGVVLMSLLLTLNIFYVFF